MTFSLTRNVGPNLIWNEKGIFRKKTYRSKRIGRSTAVGLAQKGWTVYVSPGAKAGESRWRVRVGPHPSRAEADAAAARLKTQEKLPTWVLDENGPV